MCQLTIVHSKNTDLNSKIIIPIAYNNSINNSDGTGIFSVDTNYYLKTKEPAYNYLRELYAFTKEHCSNTFVLHVRSASTNKTSIEDRFAHPYITDNYIVFHNGTFDGFAVDKDSTDTMLFAKKLSENYNKNIIEAFNKTYNGGKFALIIYDLNTKKLYVLKGETAPLYLYKVKILDENMTIINTQDNTLETTLNNMLLNIKLFSEHKENPVDILEKVDIEKNKAYEFNTNNGKLQKIGEVKETIKRSVYQSVYNNVWNDNEFVTHYNYSHTIIDAVLNSLSKMLLSPFELELILHKNYNKTFTSYIDTTILSKVNEELLKLFDTKKLELWKEIVKRNKDLFILDIYKKYSLKVPYFANREEDLIKCI